MNNNYLSKHFACPSCKTKCKKEKQGLRCISCKTLYSKKNGIWNFLYTQNNIGESSKKQYDHMHKHTFGGPQDGSYEILAHIAKGNKTLDIACGEGIIEKLAPQTVGLEFSLNALKKAQKNGAKYLVLADAHYLPFQVNTFDIAISSGNLEHFENPQLSISEMARVSKMQILIVHKQLPFPFASLIHDMASNILHIKHQPIEKPIHTKKLEEMIKKAGLSIIYKGVWTFPVNYGRVIPFLPELKSIPSCSFVISIKK